MYSKVAILILSAAAAVSAAVAGSPAAKAANTAPGQWDSKTQQCTVGKLECCQSLQSPNSQTVQKNLSPLGIVASTLQGFVGVQCSPLTVAGLGGNSCTAAPTCCAGSKFNGLITIACSPIIINL